MSRQSLHIVSLDGLRGLAVVIVFVHHAGLNGFPGPFGVTIFFFLSGFLITTLLRAEYDAHARISLRDFYLRRILRIFPPFYVVLAGVSVLTAVGVLKGAHLTAPAVLSQILYVSNYYDLTDPGWSSDRAPGSWVYWSLAVEEHFYLGFPILYVFLRRRFSSASKQAAVLLGICSAVLCWRLILVYALMRGGRAYVATDTRLDSILYGCILAIVANPSVDRARVSDIALRRFWLPIGLAGLLVSLLVRGSHFQESMSYTIQGLCLAPVFVAAIRFGDRAPFRALNSRPVRFLGVLSYSIYLVHNTVIIGLSQYLRAPRPIAATIAAVLSVLIAAGIHQCIEKPCAKLRWRLSHVGQLASVSQTRLSIQVRAGEGSSRGRAVTRAGGG